MVQFAEIFDPKTHITTTLPIHLIYKEGDILLIPIPESWTAENIEKFREYTKEVFKEFSDVRLIPNQICCQVLRKSEDICLDEPD